LYLHKLIAWAQIVAESKFPPFVSCCPFPVLQIRVVSSPCSPLSMQLEPVTHVLVFVSSTQQPFKDLGLGLLTLLLHYFCLYLHFCYFLPVVLCCPAVFRPTDKNRQESSGTTRNHLDSVINHWDAASITCVLPSDYCYRPVVNWWSSLGMSGFCDSVRAEFAQNRPPCTEFGVLCRIEENLPNGTENAKILLIFVNPFTYNG